MRTFLPPGKAMVGKRPRPFDEALCFDSIESTLIFGEYDAAPVDSIMRSLRREALANGIALQKLRFWETDSIPERRTK
jgi:hypothetical protein